jgi:heme A synthase
MGAAVASPAGIRTTSFTRYAYGVLAWNIGVVLWGAYVRASGSGAGCGNNWPLCNGEVLPHAPRVQTIIEFSHRASTGVAGFAIAGLLAWSLFLFPRWHRVQKAALASVAFLIVEIALGAGLVLLQYVEANASVGRALYLSLHLVNTQLLLAALALTAWFARDASRGAGRISKLLAGTLPVALLVSVSGAIAALGDTLFPASSLSEGIRQDLSGTGHFLLRLRIFHPALAILGGVFFVWVAARTIRSRPLPQLSRIALAVLVLTLGQLSAGALNLALLAPIWMQMVHLLMADLVWISLVLMTVESGRRHAGSFTPAC